MWSNKGVLQREGRGEGAFKAEEIINSFLWLHMRCPRKVHGAEEKGQKVHTPFPLVKSGWQGKWKILLPPSTPLQLQVNEHFLQ